MIKNATIYCEDPYIASYEEVVTPIECQQLIELSRNQLKKSQVASNSDEELGIYSSIRKSEQAWLPHHPWLPHHLNPIVLQICKRMAETVGLPLHHAEPLQVAKYSIDGRFEAHWDTYRTPQKGGQRLMTAILYLNDVEQGGETAFSDLNLAITPTVGKILQFETCKKGTIEPHPLSKHEGCPVQKGEKWIATLWFRERPQYKI
ncbi:prolyl 4-hydroxylase [Croceifilum oryzae]|uniref:Prolyl 4-hydroxylase n=1 Tax=Croceifilum oryzae TaxID=1553429 RepID=A0AAJ1WRL5_9BACL|nr:2OG-Fe(II) oxygenase [Croceifilum oryzae]MDQ0418647.1 prolyl 4-hydroxylase [Croceifilum oryzae]